jgi:hypothetical protein
VERVRSSVGLPAADCGFDQLHQPPRREQQLRLIGACLPRRGKRLVVATEAAVEHRACPADDAQDTSLAAGHEIVEVGLDHLGELRLATPPANEGQRAVRRQEAPGRLGDRLRFRKQRSGGGQFAGELVPAHALVQRREKRVTAPASRQSWR